MATASPPSGDAERKVIYSRESKKTPTLEDLADEEPTVPGGSTGSAGINADDPLFGQFASAGIGNMPELTALLQDDEILDAFNNELTKKYLREISMDPSVIDSLLDKPEIKFLTDKIKAQFEKTGNPQPGSAK